MRDVTLEEICDAVQKRIELTQGIKLPRALVRKVARQWIAIMKRVIATDRDRLVMREADIVTIYKPIDMDGLCQDLADGKDIPTYDTFIRKHRLSRRVAHFVNNPDFRRTPSICP